MPIYYRTFPGNMPDSMSLETILLDVDHAGFRDVVLITDRGYDKLRNLEKYILQGQAMIMCTKVHQQHVLDRILSFGEFNTHPEGMELDLDMRLYYQQYDLEYGVEDSEGVVRAADRLRLNLYFDVFCRGEELMYLESEIGVQRVQLEALLQKRAVLGDDATLRRLYGYFKITYDSASTA